jgi:AraC-like DNA-binding protein
MRYAEYAPIPALAPYVRCLWTLNDEFVRDALAETIVPDGCCEIVLNFADRFRRVHPSGSGRESTLQPEFLVAGQLEGPLAIAPTGVVDLLGIRFEPAGIFPFLRFSLREIAGSQPDLADVSKRFSRTCESANLAGIEPPARVKRVQEALVECVDGRSVNWTIAECARRIERCHQLIPISELASDVDLSVRQLERRFADEVGMSPKRFARIVRFRRVIRRLNDPRPFRWADAAVDFGFFDQPHLIREFRAFTGRSPREYCRDRNELASHFASVPKDEMSDSYKTSGSEGE